MPSNEVIDYVLGELKPYAGPDLNWMIEAPHIGQAAASLRMAKKSRSRTRRKEYIDKAVGDLERAENIIKQEGMRQVAAEVIYQLRESLRTGEIVVANPDVLDELRLEDEERSPFNKWGGASR